jgi:hypothetical protein
MTTNKTTARAKYRGLSAARRTMMPSTASVEMTFFFCVGDRRCKGPGLKPHANPGLTATATTTAPPAATTAKTSNRKDGQRHGREQRQKQIPCGDDNQRGSDEGRRSVGRSWLFCGDFDGGKNFRRALIYTCCLPCKRRDALLLERISTRKIPGTRQPEEAGTREVKVVSQA